MAQTRISDADHARLQRIAEETGQSQQDILHRALETYERDLLLDSINAGFAEMRADPDAWAEELAERTAWDTATAPLDGDA